MMKGLTKAKTKQNKTPCETWLEEAEAWPEFKATP